MPTSDEDIAELLTRASTALEALTRAQDASADAKAAAKQSYKDVLRLIARHAISTYEGRTAALSGLIVELQEVTKAIETENALAGHVSDLTGIAGRATDLFKEAKAQG